MGKVFVCDSEGKKFWSKTQVKKYLEKNTELQIDDSARKILFASFKQLSKKRTVQYDLVLEAIKGLGKPKGAKKSAIKRYMQEHFKDRAKNFTFLSKTLKACVEGKTVIQNGKLFKLPKECDQVKKKTKDDASLSPKKMKQRTGKEELN